MNRLADAGAADATNTAQNHAQPAAALIHPLPSEDYG
jgi:hypothetical protein